MLAKATGLREEREKEKERRNRKKMKVQEKAEKGKSVSEKRITRLAD